jgi:alkylhydroperoxidase/carboxymuconolactone decarboxylase family protein YurZ
MLHHSIRSKHGWGLKHTAKHHSSEAYIDKARKKIAASKESVKQKTFQDDWAKRHRGSSYDNMSPKDQRHADKMIKKHHRWGNRFKRLRAWGHQKRMGAYIGYKKHTMANRERSTEHKNAEHEQHATTILGMNTETKSRALGTLGIGSDHQRDRLARAHTGDPKAKFKDLSEKHQAHVISRVMRHRGLSQAVSAMKGLHAVSEARRNAHLKPEDDE